jgi:hypothetical protein
VTVFDYILSYDDEEAGKRQARGRKGDLKDVICLSCLLLVCPAFYWFVLPFKITHLSKKQARGRQETGNGVMREGTA